MLKIKVNIERFVYTLLKSASRIKQIFIENGNYIPTLKTYRPIVKTPGLVYYVDL